MLDGLDDPGVQLGECDVELTAGEVVEVRLDVNPAIADPDGLHLLEASDGYFKPAKVFLVEAVLLQVEIDLTLACSTCCVCHSTALSGVIGMGHLVV